MSIILTHLPPRANATTLHPCGGCTIWCSRSHWRKWPALDDQTPKLPRPRHATRAALSGQVLCHLTSNPFRCGAYASASTQPWVEVTFRYTEGKTDAQKRATLPVDTFIGRFLAHVRPKG